MVSEQNNFEADTASVELTEPLQTEVLKKTRFCSQCGSERDSESGACPQCTAAIETISATESRDEQYGLDMRALRSAVWLYFTLLGVSAAALIWYRVDTGQPTMFSEFVTSGAFSLVVTCWAVASFGLVLEPLKAKFHPLWILGALVAAVPTYFLATGVVEFLASLGVEKLDYLSTYNDEGYGLGWAVVLICVQPAIFEEIAFRGIVQGSLERVLGMREALIVSALMFGILHLSIPSLPHLLVLGLALGWLRIRTKSLLPGMALHFMHNFLVVRSEAVGGLLTW